MPRRSGRPSRLLSTAAGGLSDASTSIFTGWTIHWCQEFVKQFVWKRAANPLCAPAKPARVRIPRCDRRRRGLTATAEQGRGVQRDRGEWCEQSVGSAPAQDGRQRAQQDLRVQPDRAVVDVLRVEAHDLLEVGHGAPAIYLPEAGKARSYLEAAEMVRLVRREVFHEEGARPDQAHIAANDVPQLRQLVERGAA